MISRDIGHRWYCLTEKYHDLGVVGGGLRRRRTDARIERVAVQCELAHAFEQRAQLREPAHPARAIPKVDIGEDARDFVGHGSGLAAYPDAQQSQTKRRSLAAEACRAFPGRATRGMRLAWLILGLIGSVRLALAGQVDEIVRVHLEVIGGKERIATLAAMRVSGYVVAGGKRVRFTLSAARPDRIRLETEGSGRTLVQGSDGAEPPWEFDTGAWPPHFRAMAEGAARRFAADAEFDDPLVAGADRGYVLEFGGEVEFEGRKLWRVLVTRKLTETFSLLIDPDSYLITLRVESRTSPGGRSVQIATRYAEFRPVEGVLLPYEITVLVDGRVSQQTKIDSIEANPTLSAETFSRAKSAVFPEPSVKGP